MIKGAEKKYSIEKTDNLLIIKTSFFEAEKGSVLHGDIYNRELTSILASIAVAGVFYLVFVMGFHNKIVAFILSTLVLIAGFAFFRKFIFKGRYMETIFDNSSGTTEISLTGVFGKKREIFATGDVREVRVESRKTGIENPDGVAFVEKISAQHGMVIPGFGEEKIFHMLKLKLSDGSDRVIYADISMHDVMTAHQEIKEFLKIQEQAQKQRVSKNEI
ncbi:MAG: hypothetical protein AB1632_11995 [Nitrospirota bacterium]